MKDKLEKLYTKYKSIILYMVFGAGTTVVNIVTYYVMYDLLSAPNVPSDIAAWITSVLFAFVTNRRYVFEQTDNSARRLARDFISFVGCRLATGVLDVAIMYLSVDVMGWNGLVWKMISNVIVIVLNYIASKYFIFKKEQT